MSALPRSSISSRSSSTIAWISGVSVSNAFGVKLVLRVGDVAYLSNRWTLTGARTRDGSLVDLAATTAEVARRQPDRSWRFVIDNPWGDQAAP
jgi:ketosteroid isomerase-like protein